jgi:hypothetical protein
MAAFHPLPGRLSPCFGFENHNIHHHLILSSIPDKSEFLPEP